MGKKPAWKLMDELDAKQLPGSVSETWMSFLKLLAGVVAAIFILGLGSRWM